MAGKLLARRLYAGSTEKMDYNSVPTTVFTPIEYSACGMTEAAAIAAFGQENIEVTMSWRYSDWCRCIMRTISLLNGQYLIAQRMYATRKSSAIWKIMRRLLEFTLWDQILVKLCKDMHIWSSRLVKWRILNQFQQIWSDKKNAGSSCWNTPNYCWRTHEIGHHKTVWTRS